MIRGLSADRRRRGGARLESLELVVGHHGAGGEARGGGKGALLVGKRRRRDGVATLLRLRVLRRGGGRGEERRRCYARSAVIGAAPRARAAAPGQVPREGMCFHARTPVSISIMLRRDIRESACLSESPSTAIQVAVQRTTTVRASFLTACLTVN